MTHIRPPAMSGRFYPANPADLRAMVSGYLSDASHQKPSIVPKAIIAPHAGYLASGPIAGSAFKMWQGQMADVQRIVVIGPTHTMAFRGLATVSASAFRTPLGDVPVDQEAIERIRPLPFIHINDHTHAQEHGLEVMLPFLQTIGQDMTIIPLVVGQATGTEVAQVLETLWGGSETRLIISSDLSHYHNYQTAKQLDQATAVAITQYQPDKLDINHACGYRPVQGLLHLAKESKLVAQTLDLRNSGDTIGSKDRVVGYGAFSFTDSHLPNG